MPLDEQYRMNKIAFDLVVGGYGLGRVIARPFVGEPGRFTRTSNRRDFAMVPTSETTLDRLTAGRVPVVAIGKIDDLFAGRGVTTRRATMRVSMPCCPRWYRPRTG